MERIKITITFIASIFTREYCVKKHPTCIDRCMRSSTAGTLITVAEDYRSFDFPRLSKHSAEFVARSTAGSGTSDFRRESAEAFIPIHRVARSTRIHGFAMQAKFLKTPLAVVRAAARVLSSTVRGDSMQSIFSLRRLLHLLLRHLLRLPPVLPLAFPSTIEARKARESTRALDKTRNQEDRQARRHSRVVSVRTDSRDSDRRQP